MIYRFFISLLLEMDGRDTVDLHLPTIPRAITLCEQGKFEQLFSLYDLKLCIHGYHPSDYLTTSSRKSIAANIEAKQKLISMRCTSDAQSMNSLPAFVGYQSIQYAAAQGNVIAVRKLIQDYKCSQNYFSPNNAEGMFCETPLCLACYYGHLDIVKYLVEECNSYFKEYQVRVFDLLCWERAERFDQLYTRDYSHKHEQLVSKKLINLDGKMSDNHIEIIIFLLRYCNLKIIPDSLFKCIVFPNDFNITLFLNCFNIFNLSEEFSGLKNYVYICKNIEIIKFLIITEKIIPNSQLLADVSTTNSSEEVISMLVSLCETNPIFNLVNKNNIVFQAAIASFPNSQLFPHARNTISEVDSFRISSGFEPGNLIEKVIDLIAYAGLLTRAPSFMLNSLLEKFGDTQNPVNNQNILHYICKRESSTECSIELVTYVAKVKPQLQSMPDSNLQLPLHLVCNKIAIRCHKNYIFELIDAVSNNCDINACDKDGNTPLHIACQIDSCHGNRQVVEYLIFKKEAAMFSRNNKGMIPMHYIYKNRLLSIHLPHTDEVDEDGITLLHIACMLGDIQFIREIHLPHTDEVDEDGNTLLHIACMLGDIQFIRELIQANNTLVGMPNSGGKLPLHLIADLTQWANIKKGEIEEMINLLSNSQTVIIQDNEGNTPMHSACIQSKSNPALLKCFIRKMLSVSHALYNGDCKQPVHIILEYNDISLLELLPNEVNINSPEECGDTPLHLACKYHCREDIIIYLVQARGAKATTLNKEGNSPIHLTFSRRHRLSLKTYKILLEGVENDVDLQDKDGNAVLHLACDTCNEELITFLVKSKGAAISIQNNYGELPLHLILKRRSNLSIINLLVNCKIIFTQDNEGNTPLHNSCYFQLSPIIKFWLPLISNKNICTLSSVRQVYMNLKNKNNLTAFQILIDRQNPCIIWEFVSLFSLNQPYHRTLCDGLALHAMCQKPVHMPHCDGLDLHAQCQLSCHEMDEFYNVKVVEALLTPTNAIVKK